MSQRHAETGEDQESKKHKHATENRGGHISPSVRHAKGDAEQAEQGTGQRVHPAMPVFRGVRGAESLVQASGIPRQPGNLRPR